MPQDSTDEALAERAQAGDAECFGILVERYEAKLLRYGRKFLSRPEDIEDIVQNIFMNAYQNIQSFDSGQRFSPWIYRVAHNAFVNALRKNARRPIDFFDFDTLLSHPIYEDPAAAKREAEEVKRLVDTALALVPPKYREALILYYLEDMPYKEVAEVLRVPLGTVGIRLKRGREQLREAYERLHGSYGN